VAALAEFGIAQHREDRAAVVEVAEILIQTAIVLGQLAALVLLDKDSQVAAEYATTTTAKIHTTAVVAAVQADLA
jgi:hypothetical protein